MSRQGGVGVAGNWKQNGRPRLPAELIRCTLPTAS
jgi:hypothetical protein